MSKRTNFPLTIEAAHLVLAPIDKERFAEGLPLMEAYTRETLQERDTLRRARMEAGKKHLAATKDALDKRNAAIEGACRATVAARGDGYTVSRRALAKEWRAYRASVARLRKRFGDVVSEGYVTAVVPVLQAFLREALPVVRRQEAVSRSVDKTSAVATREFESATRDATAVYKKIVESATDAYLKATMPAWKKYGKALLDIDARYAKLAYPVRRAALEILYPAMLKDRSTVNRLAGRKPGTVHLDLSYFRLPKERSRGK